MIRIHLLKLGGTYWLKKKLNENISGAQFSSEDETGAYLNSDYDGLLIDGSDKRLSLTDSFQNICITARIGAGKTTQYIIPNVLSKARDKCSLVVNDPKGEIHEATSGYMKQCGYNVLVINPEDLDKSSGFNPLSEAHTDIEMEQLAEILVRSSNTGSSGKDDFWLQGAIRFISLFIKVLKNAERDNPGVYNLHNLYYLFQNYGDNGSKLDNFMSEYTINPSNVADQTLWNEWQGVMTGNPEGVQSFVLSAITSLKALSNQSLARLTAQSDIDLSLLKKEKTIIYFITPAQHAKYYGFLTSLFFKSVFNACMRQLPDKKTLPVYILYDEFGHSTIPDFSAIANTIRGYKVSLSIILQSISQLEGRYGKHEAETILGGFNSFLTYSGSDSATTEFYSRIIGKVRYSQKTDLTDPIYRHTDINLMNSNDVRSINENQALFLSKNRPPVLLDITPYYQNKSFMRQSKKTPVNQSHYQQKLLSSSTLNYVDLSC